MNKVILDGDSLTLDDFIGVSRLDREVSLSDNAINKITDSRKIVEKIVDSGIPSYGVNTGFGANSSIPISKEKADRLQENIIRSHSAGLGDAYSDEVVRGALLLRVNCFAAGYSGVRLELVNTLINMLNKGVIPIVPSRGSVGSSGDLAPLAHTALPIIGLGKAKYAGEVLDGREAMFRAGIPILPFSYKEGLAFTNGFAFGTSLGAQSLYESIRIADNADIVAAMLVESLAGITKAYRDELQLVRPHKSQIQCAKNMLNLLDGSTIIDAEGKFNVHSAYSIKSVPQVLGSLRTAIDHLEDIIQTEINSATDNPLFFNNFESGDYSLSGSNFHGQIIGNALAYLGIGLASVFKNLNGLVTRAIDEKLSDGLPPFLTNENGLNSGFMVSQYTLGSLYNEVSALTTPLVVDNVSTCASAEDVVSMGTNQARNLYKITELAYEALAIGLISATQGLYFRQNGNTRDRAELVKRFGCEMLIAADKNEDINNEILTIVDQYQKERNQLPVKVTLGSGTSKVYQSVVNQLTQAGFDMPYEDSKQPIHLWIELGVKILKDDKLRVICEPEFKNTADYMANIRKSY